MTIALYATIHAVQLHCNYFKHTYEARVEDGCIQAPDSIGSQPVIKKPQQPQSQGSRETSVR